MHCNKSEKQKSKNLKIRNLKSDIIYFIGRAGLNGDTICQIRIFALPYGKSKFRDTIDAAT